MNVNYVRIVNLKHLYNRVGLVAIRVEKNHNLKKKLKKLDFLNLNEMFFI